MNVVPIVVVTGLVDTVSVVAGIVEVTAPQKVEVPVVTPVQDIVVVSAGSVFVVVVPGMVSVNAGIVTAAVVPVMVIVIVVDSVESEQVPDCAKVPPM